MSKEFKPEKYDYRSSAEWRQSIKPPASVLSVGEFLRDLEQEATETHEIGVQTMTTDVDEYGDQIVEIFKKVPNSPYSSDPSEEKSVNKTFVSDHYMRGYSEPYIVALAKFVPGLKEKTLEYIKNVDNFFNRLKQTGTKVKEHNPLKGIVDKVFPFRNRNHEKGSWVKGGQGSSYWAHTNNFTTRLGDVDFVVKFTGKIADQLIEDWERANSKNPEKANKKTILAPGVELYRDAGVKKSIGDPGSGSIILDKALELINSSVNVKNSSILYPDGPVLKALKNTPDPVIITSKVSTLPYSLNPVNGLNVYWTVNMWNKIKYFASTLFSNNKVNIKEYPYGWAHGKLLMGVLHDGTRWAFFGSHNLSEAGVKAGTKEVQILAYDKVVNGDTITIYPQNAKIISGLKSWFTDVSTQIKYEEDSRNVELKPESKLRSKLHHAHPDA